MKTRERFKTLLLACRARIQEEVAALIGKPFKLGQPRFRHFGQEELFAQQSGRQVLAHIRIEGDVQGQGCLLVGIRDAIHVGGILIMVPEPELAHHIHGEVYTEELADSFAEIATIICDAMTATFAELYPKNLRFSRGEQEIVAPLQVTAGSEQPIADIPWYVMTVPMHLDGHDLGTFDLVLPAPSFGLVDRTSPTRTKSSPPAAPGRLASTPDPTAEQVEIVPEEHATLTEAEILEPAGAKQGVRGENTDAADILMYTDDESEGERIAAVLRQMGYAPRILHFKDPVSGVVAPRIQLIFLVMREVNEQGFGVAIKINSVGLTVPLVAAGPAWTRSLVLKAVKYGINDILVTPSIPADVQEKIERNLGQRAA